MSATPVYDALRDALQAERPVALATVIDGPTLGAKLLVEEGVPARGTLGDPDLDRVVARDALGELESGLTSIRHYGPHGEARADGVSVFVESFALPPRMVIFGAVDFTAALAKVAKVLGYRVTVCDARAVFATAARFPMADEVVSEWPDRYLAEVGPSLGPRDAVCVLTHDAKFDVPAIVGALATRVGYLGAMGSRADPREAARPAAGGGRRRRRARAPDGPDRARHRLPHPRGDGGRRLRRDHRLAHGPRRRRSAPRRHRPDPLTDRRPTERPIETGRDREGDRMDLGLGGKRAAVAASSGGLGFGVAAALAAEGAAVVVNGRDADRAGAAAARIGAHAVAGDVGTADGARAFVEEAAELLGGGIDVLVTNAGGPPAGTATDFVGDLDQYRRALELNCLSVIAMCDAAVPGMRASRWGRVVAITSISVREPIPHLVLSNTARAGVTGYLKTLAREVAPDGVTVNSLQPGLHDTDRLRALYGGDASSAGGGIPAGVVGDPADFGAVAAFLCSAQARFLTGTAIPVDGGTFGGLQ